MIAWIKPLLGIVSGLVQFFNRRAIEAAGRAKQENELLREALEAEKSRDEIRQTIDSLGSAAVIDELREKPE